MNIVQRPLPSHCYGKREQDRDQYMSPMGIVWHYVSDRYGHHGDDPYSIDSVIAILTDYGFSYHYVIDRDGTIYELVHPPLRAFHAGVSEWAGRDDCNDWMVGIAQMGMHGEPFEDQQYKAGMFLTGRLTTRFPIHRDWIAGHEDVAPGRKQDPGPSWDWNRYNRGIEGFFLNT